VAGPSPGPNHRKFLSCPTKGGTSLHITVALLLLASVTITMIAVAVYAWTH
jgi:hypothetical protein